jgi:hypothetical protein
MTETRVTSMMMFSTPLAFAALTLILLGQSPSTISVGSASRPQETDWQRENLRGRVKVIQERWANGTNTRQYDEQGFLFRSHVAGGSTQWVDSSVFEGNERRTYTTFSDYRSGELMSAPRSIKVIRWDSMGRVTEAQFIDYESGQVQSSDTYRYDASGKLIEKQHRDYDAGPTLSSSPKAYSELYTYAKGTRPTRVIEKDTIGLVLRENGFEYDAQGRVSRRGERRPPEPFIWVTAKYNKQGDLVEESATIKGMRVAEKFAYEYDDRGNWIKMTKTWIAPKEMMKKPKPPEVTYRQIVYYDRSVSFETPG